MSQALTVIGDRSRPLDERVGTLRDLMMKQAPKLEAAAAGTLTGERLVQVACNSIRKNPELLSCTVPSLFGAISEAATYGWVCDGILGHAYLVPFQNRQRNCKEVVLIPGYKGLRDLINRSGKCSVSIESVHEGDDYEYRGKFELPKHDYSKSPQRRFDPVTHAYVVGHFTSGRILCVSWTAGECIAHRDRYSQSWKRVAGNEAKAKESPWHPENPSFRVMCMKTVLLDAVHRGEFPMSVQDQQVASREIAPAATVESEVSTPEFDLIEHDEGTVDAAPAPEPDVDIFAECSTITACDEAYKDWEQRNPSVTAEQWEQVAAARDARKEVIRSKRGQNSNTVAETA